MGDVHFPGGGSSSGLLRSAGGPWPLHGLVIDLVCIQDKPRRWGAHGTPLKVCGLARSDFPATGFSRV